MSYISGNADDFASRLHQLATDDTSLSSFITEGDGYISSVDSHLVDKWEKEARLAKFRFTQNPIDLITPLFSAGPAGVISSFSSFKTNESYGTGAVFDSNRPIYSNGKLYFQDGAFMFYVMDVSNGVDNLVVLGSLDLSSLSPVGFVLNGNVVYALAANSDIGVINIAISSSPTLVTTIISSDNAQSPWYGAFIKDNYLYVSCTFGGGGGDGKLFIYNVTAPLLPLQVGIYISDGSDPKWNGGGNWGGGHFGNAAIKDDILYVPNYFSSFLLGGEESTAGEFYVVDVSDKSNPVIVNTVSLVQGNDVVGNFESWTMIVNGNYLYINDDRNIACYDITASDSPQYIGMAASDDGDTESAIIVGNTILWACNSSASVVAWDISNGLPVQSAKLAVVGASSNGLGYDPINKVYYFMSGGFLSQVNYVISL